MGFFFSVFLGAMTRSLNFLRFCSRICSFCDINLRLTSGSNIDPVNGAGFAWRCPGSQCSNDASRKSNFRSKVDSRASTTDNLYFADSWKLFRKSTHFRMPHSTLSMKSRSFQSCGTWLILCSLGRDTNAQSVTVR